MNHDLYYLFRGDSLIWSGESPSEAHKIGRDGDILFGYYRFSRNKIEYKAWRWQRADLGKNDWVIIKYDALFDVDRYRTLVLLQT